MTPRESRLNVAEQNVARSSEEGRPHRSPRVKAQLVDRRSYERPVGAFSLRLRGSGLRVGGAEHAGFVG